jgi:ABC-2 type transport system ATP-binding protein
MLLTTHDMIEAEQLCEQVLIIDRGRLVRGATVRALRAEVARSVGSLLEVETRLPIAPTVLAAVPGLLRSEQDGARVLRVFSREPAAAAGYLVDHAGDALVNISISAPSLEDAYLASTAAAAADQ